MEPVENDRHELGRLAAAVESIRFLATVGVFGAIVGAMISIRNATVLTRVEGQTKETNGRLSQVEQDHAEARGAQGFQEKLMRFAVLPAIAAGVTLAAAALTVAARGGF